MESTNRARIFRAIAGGALLMLMSRSTLANNCVPDQAGLWKPAMSADLVGQDVPALFASDSTEPVFEIYFNNLEPVIWKLDPRKRVSDPPPPGYLRPDPRYIWIYSRGKWTLAIGPAGAGEDSRLTVQLLRQVDEPATFLVMGTGLILLIVGLRRKRRRAEQQKSRAAGRTGARLVMRLG